MIELIHLKDDDDDDDDDQIQLRIHQLLIDQIQHLVLQDSELNFF